MLDFSPALVPISSTITVGLVAWVGANLTRSRRLRRALERDAALLAHIPEGAARSRLEVLVERDAAAYGRLRAMGPASARLIGLRASAAVVIVGAAISATSTVLLSETSGGSLLGSLAWYGLAFAVSVYFIMDARRDATKMREVRLAAVDGEATRRRLRTRAPIGARLHR